jgi:hypothetical protein
MERDKRVLEVSAHANKTKVVCNTSPINHNTRINAVAKDRIASRA